MVSLNNYNTFEKEDRAFKANTLLHYIYPWFSERFFPLCNSSSFSLPITFLHIWLSVTELRKATCSHSNKNKGDSLVLTSLFAGSRVSQPLPFVEALLICNGLRNTCLTNMKGEESSSATGMIVSWCLHTAMWGLIPRTPIPHGALTWNAALSWFSRAPLVVAKTTAWCQSSKARVPWMCCKTQSCLHRDLPVLADSWGTTYSCWQGGYSKKSIVFPSPYLCLYPFVGCIWHQAQRKQGKISAVSSTV